MKKSLSNSISTPWTNFYEGFSSKLKHPDGSMFELIEETAKKYPNNTAYEYFGKGCSYKSLIKKINTVAKSLKAYGVKQGDIVTICMPNTPPGIITFYAVNLVGGIANMIHPLSSENEIKEFLNKTNSNFILTIDLSYEKIIKIASETSIRKIVVSSPADNMKLVMRYIYKFFKQKKVNLNNKNFVVSTWPEFLYYGRSYYGIYKARRKSLDPAVILYSGGTTGAPKGILLSNLNFNALAVQAHLMCDPSKEGDSILSIMPIFHGFGLAVSIHTPLYIGMKCVLIPQFNPKRFSTIIKKYKPNFILGVPTLYEALIKYGKFKNKDLASVTCLISGGDILSEKTKNKIDNIFFQYGSKAQLRCGYGLTESTAASCLTPTNDYRSGSIGIPFPDMYYKIVKIGTHDEVPYETDGEICISGPSVMIGYYNDLKETVQILREHSDGKIWLHTGDVGSMDKDGFVYFKQRIKRIIVSSGYNIYPSYIENVINQHPSVLTSTVIGIDHPYKVQVAKAFIILKPDIKLNAELKKSIKVHCEKNISKYSLPYEYEYRKSLPTTLVGKVAYKELEKEEQSKN